MVKGQFILQRIEQLIEQSVTYESSFMDNPTPTWHKRIVGGDRLVMDMVNPAYTHATGISVQAYQGQEDRRVWEHQSAESFGANDHEVIRLRTKLPIEEPAKNPVSNKVEIWVGWKWPRFDSDGEVVGVWGQAVAYPEDVWHLMRQYHPVFGDRSNE